MREREADAEKRPARTATRERLTGVADWMRALPAPFATTFASEDDGGRALLRAALGLLLLVIAGAVSLRLMLRLAGSVAVVSIVLACSVGNAYAQDVIANCDSPPGNRDHCDRWYTTEWVSLTWAPTAGGLIVSGCQNGSFLSEAPPLRRSCTVRWGSTVETRDIWIGIDRTPPQLVGLAPDRSPDHGDWFNHPLAFSFRGADATSGIDSCTAGTYGGPDVEGVLVSGGCRDVAGNVASGAFPLNYDATPPKPPKLEAVPGDERVRLDWSLAGGAVAVEVVRVAPGADAVVYSGSEGDFVDRRRRNGVRQRYRVTGIDRAGNRAATSASVVPTDSPLLTPAEGSHLQNPPLLTWKDRRRATYYNVQLFRGGRKVLSRWPRTNELRLERTWRFAGQRRRLVPGRYVWFVWPGFGERAERDYGRMLGKQSFVIAR